MGWFSNQITYGAHTHRIPGIVRPLLTHKGELLLYSLGLGGDSTSYLGSGSQKVGVIWRYAGSQFLFTYWLEHDRPWRALTSPLICDKICSRSLI
jgi:hypothetical protein